MQHAVKTASDKKSWEKDSEEGWSNRGVNGGSVTVSERKGNPGSLSHNPVPWWDRECQQALNKRQLAFKKYRADSSLSNFVTYKKNRAEARKLLRQKKRDSFRLGSSWKVLTDLPIRDISGKKIKVFKDSKYRVEWSKWSGKDRSKVIEEKVAELAPPWVEQEEDCRWKSHDGSSEEFPEFSLPFVAAELTRALTVVRSESAPGLDRIDYKMLKYLPDGWRTKLLKIFTLSWRRVGYLRNGDNTKLYS